MLNYCMDLNIFSYNSFSKEIFLYQSFDKDLADTQNTTFFINYINHKIANCQNLNISLQLPLIIVVILLVFPLYFFLKKRLIFHEKIFDLIVSLDSNLIVK